MVGGKLLHHGFVFVVGEVGVPVVGATSGVVHDGHLAHRGRGHQRGLIAVLDEVVILALVGVCDDGLAIGAVNRTEVADGLDLGRFQNGKGEVILTSLLHELLKVFLTVLGKNVATDDCGKNKDKTT